MVLEKQRDKSYTKSKQIIRNHSTNLNGQDSAAIFNFDIPLCFVGSFSEK
jgi:hypothetical protein